MRRRLYYGDPINRAHPLNRGLVARLRVVPWYASGPRMIDLCGRNHGIISGGAVRHGPLGRPAGTGSVGVDGTDGPNVNLGVSAYALGIRRSATFAGWVRSNGAFTAGGPVLISDWNSNNGITLRLDNTFSPSGLTFYAYPNNHRVNVNAGIATNAWAHIAGVLDGANSYAYINGVQVGSAVLGEDVGSSASPLRLMFRGDLGTTQTGAGDVDDVCIWNRALAAREFEAFYQFSRRLYDPTLNWIRRRSRIASGAAPAGFKAAWATRRAQVIGGGTR